MLSGPITQEAGITETRVREEEREQGRLGRWRNGEEETVVRREEELEKLRCMKTSWKVTELQI